MTDYQSGFFDGAQSISILWPVVAFAVWYFILRRPKEQEQEEDDGSTDN